MDILSDILDTLKLSGCLFFRSELEPPWGVDVPVEGRKAMLHIIADGCCCMQLGDAPEPLLLQRGDLVLMTQVSEQPHKLYDVLDSPYQHQQGVTCGVDRCVTPAGPAELATLPTLEQPVQPPMSDKTVLICGYFEFDEEILHPVFQTLPAKMHVQTQQETRLRWLDNTICLIRDEAFSERPGAEAIANRMSEILYINTLRVYIEEHADSVQGISALHDRYINRALTVIHSQFDQTLSVETLATQVGLSRSAFSQRFSKLMGVSTLEYITHWRLQKAKQMLLQTDQNMLEIALQIGYQTEAAFNKVFKRHFGISPGTYRRKQYLVNAL